jgi:uncharacterized protein
MNGMEASGWGFLIAAGWLAGFCSGLLGIGGGLVVVPAMIIGLPMLGVSGSELSKIATATSLLLVIPTSVASAQAHAARGSLDWAYWGALAPSIVAGGLVTSMLVQHISASVVTLLFVGFSLVSAWRLLVQQSPAADALIDLTPSQLVGMSVKGLLGGALSTALGIGVAFFAVPMLSRFVAMGRAIGTASMLALPMAMVGAAGYLFAPTPEGCASCTGYVHLPAVGRVNCGRQVRQGIAGALALTTNLLSGRHLPAAFRTRPAGLNAFLHSFQPFAVFGALLTNLGAFAAGVLVVRAVDQHEMRRRPTDLGAGHHQPEMLRFGVLAAVLEAMGHRRAKAGLVAIKACVDTCAHF